MNNFTGYNIEQINILAGQIKDSYNSIGMYMANPWGVLQNTMQTEWVGPDEQSYEEQLANQICQLYDECAGTVRALYKYIITIGEAWKEFQKNNVLSGATQYLAVGELDNNGDLEAYDIRNTVKLVQVPFNETTNYGLANGQDSYNKINSALEDYLSNIRGEIKKFYGELDASNAFLGQNQAATLNEYMVRVGNSLSDIATLQTAINAALAKLLANYDSQAAEFTNAASTAQAGDTISFGNNQ